MNRDNENILAKMNNSNLSLYETIGPVDGRHGVELVRHVDTGQLFVKKILDHYDSDVFEYLKEAKLTGIPEIIEIHDVGSGDDAESEGTNKNGQLIVIEEYIDGNNLDVLLNERCGGCFSEAAVANIITSLCEILAPLHAHVPTIVHRDIKASNVILREDNSVCLIDFDASKKVDPEKNRDTDLIGTVEYAAPEQYGFGQSDQRTDIYALGVLMNKLLTGKFLNEEKAAGRFQKVIDRATSLSPDNRYQTVDEMKQAIEIAQDLAIGIDSEIVSQPHSLIEKLTLPIRALPGFRGGKWYFIIPAFLWYAFLVVFGLFHYSDNVDFSANESNFFDYATFLLLFVPTLYLGNYFGIRDKFPKNNRWKFEDRKILNLVIEILRIAIGLAIIVASIFIIVTIVGDALGV